MAVGLVLVHPPIAHFIVTVRALGATRFLLVRLLSGLAKAERVNASYLSRILRLTLIAPDIIEAVLAGRQPSTLQLDDLLKTLPAAWAQQNAQLFGSP